MILCPVVWIFPPVEFVNYLLPPAWGFWLCVVVTEAELEEKIIPLLVLFFHREEYLLWVFRKPLPKMSKISDMGYRWPWNVKTSHERVVGEWLAIVPTPKIFYGWLTPRSRGSETPDFRPLCTPVFFHPYHVHTLGMGMWDICWTHDVGNELANLHINTGRAGSHTYW